MSRFLFFIAPFYGHVNPALNVVNSLTARGEDVVFYTGQEYREAAWAAGATFRAVPEPRPGRGGFLDEPALDMVFQVLQATVDSARSEKPDCVVYDPMSIPGLLLARILGVPTARLHVQFPINASYHPFDTFSPAVPVRPRFVAFDRDMRKLCDYYRVPAIEYHEAVFRAEPLNIVPFPKSFVPSAETFDERFHFVGPLFDVPAETANPAPSEPLLYVSLGTVHSNMPSFYDICITAFGNKSRRVVISIGDEVDSSLFGPIPDNVILHRRAPQMKILEQAGSFINHAGVNSVSEALYYGVPMLVVPMTLEQETVAKRMEELKLGVIVKQENVTSHVLKDTVARLDENQEIRSAVGRMQRAIRESGGYRQAADLLQQYAS